MAAASGTMLLDAAERVRQAAGPPTTQLGTSQRTAPWSAPVIDEHEIARDLAWPRFVQHTVPGMLNDAQVEGLYRGATMPIRSYRFWLDPNGASDAAVQRISANYGLPIGADGRMNLRRSQNRFRFDRHLEDALRAIAYGHGFFEQVGNIGDDGLWHFRKAVYFPPRVIRDIKPARDGGLSHITVPALDPEREGVYSGLTGVHIPVSRLIAYVWDQEGSNWRGRSMFRSLYRPWKLKDRVLRVGAINIDRAGGIPYIEAPPDATGPQLRELHALAAAFRVGESAGAALPHGAQLKFASAAGGAEAINYVRLQNEEMSRSWLMMFLQSGQTSTGHGSTQQVEQQINYFGLVQQAIAQWFCDIFNEHQIEDDVEWNEGELEEYAPLLRFTPQGDPLGALADEIDNARVAGALPADSRVAQVIAAVQHDAIAVDGPLENWIREQLGAPAKDQTEAPSGKSFAYDYKILTIDERRAQIGLPPLPNGAGEGFPEPPEVATASNGAASPPPAVASSTEPRRRRRAPASAATGVRPAAEETVDFDALQQAWQDELDDLVADWGEVQSGQVDSLVEQIAATTDLSELAAVQADVAGAERLAEAMRRLLTNGAEAVVAEAAAQGATITAPDLDDLDEAVEARAVAVAELLARSISETAGRHAVQRTGGSLTATEVAAQVREHLEGLTDAYLRDQLGGALTQAQAIGRREVMRREPPIRIYASALLDPNACDVCAETDGREYASLEEAEVDFPTGGNAGCLGGPRCRCTLVAVYAEAEAA